MTALLLKKKLFDDDISIFFYGSNNCLLFLLLLFFVTARFVVLRLIVCSVSVNIILFTSNVMLYVCICADWTCMTTIT
ncbi:MAG: hypothetical protein EXX96DRAFT_588744 [Benjaminiella poitrasii]|nr:MAG: hypothetical protein EXX96DRAFT_588744 [Benjaminiella poitrasii]